MKRARRAFPTVYRAMIAAGENAGRLPLIAGRLADLTDRQAHVRGRLGAALAYPAALCLVALGVVTGLMVAVVPRVVEQFDAASRQLPWLTRVVIALSNGLAAWGWLFGLLAVLAGFGLVRGLGWPPFRARFDAALLRVPLLGSLWRDAQAAALARTLARTLATMIEAQLPLLDGLRLAAGTAVNTVHRRALIDVAGGVREGARLRAGSRRPGSFRHCWWPWPPVARLRASSAPC
jgi:general secretion pathway protein F